MRRFLPGKPSAALVLAGIALLAALDGTSVAAVTSVPKNSVGTAQLKNNAVTAAKLGSNAVTGPKIADNAITSAKVENQSLLAQDFAPGQLPKRPPGPPGTVGKLVLRSKSV